jgi:hypothetical protein
VTAPLIAPVIPSGPGPARSGRGAPGRAGAPSLLPLADPPSAPPGPGDAVYGIGRIDASGRVADRSVTSVLGWRTGDRLTLSEDHGAVIVRRDPGGMVTLPPRPYITIPPPFATAARCAPATGCCWPPSRARTCSPPTRSPWWTGALRALPSFPAAQGARP